MNADERGKDAADEKEKCDGSEIEQRDALVVSGEEPRADSVRRVQIMFARKLVFAAVRIWCGAHDLFLPRCRLARGGFPRHRLIFLGPDIRGQRKKLVFGDPAPEGWHHRLKPSNNFCRWPKDW